MSVCAKELAMFDFKNYDEYDWYLLAFALTPVVVIGTMITLVAIS